MNRKIFAGIGSRETPDEILESMEIVAYNLINSGYKLRSGGAMGADSAFADGAKSAIIKSLDNNLQLKDIQEIYLPWDGFNCLSVDNNKGIYLESNKEAVIIAEKYHPKYSSLSKGAKLLMNRNSYQILGKYLNDPVEFVICWTRGGKIVGGTGQALRIAVDYNIPTINMASSGWEDKIKNYLKLDGEDADWLVY